VAECVVQWQPEQWAVILTAAAGGLAAVITSFRNNRILHHLDDKPPPTLRCKARPSDGWHFPPSRRKRRDRSRYARVE
jgi:hypothetical protein